LASFVLFPRLRVVSAASALSYLVLIVQFKLLQFKVHWPRSRTDAHGAVRHARNSGILTVRSGGWSRSPELVSAAFAAASRGICLMKAKERG
jgi:hypothetical protein